MKGPGPFDPKKASRLGAIASAVLLVALVILIERSASPGLDRADATVSRTAAAGPGDLSAQGRPTPPAQIIVVRTTSDGALRCTMIPSRRASGEGPMLYHWTGPSLQTTRCRPVSAGGLGGPGLGL